MDLKTLKTISEIAQHIAVALAVIVGGAWTLYRFIFQRSYETTLEMDLSTNCSPCENGHFMVFVDVVLKNKSRRRLSARPKKYSEGQPNPVLQDVYETLNHSVALQIKRIRPGHADGFIDWFRSEDCEELQSIPREINLLGEYETSKIGAVDFYLEPGDTYHLGAMLILPPGDYLGKGTFIGCREFEFWRRFFHLRVS